MILAIIAAVDEDNVIGLGNTLPWDLPADMKHFRKKTEGHIVIMGRNTFDSIMAKRGGPLPNRRNVVISRKGDLYDGEYDVVSSLDEAIELAERAEEQEAFIIGGAQIYAAAMDIANRIYLTRIHHRFEGDAFFPEISESEWTVISEERHEQDQANLWPYTFFVYERRKE